MPPTEPCALRGSGAMHRAEACRAAAAQYRFRLSGRRYMACRAPACRQSDRCGLPCSFTALRQRGATVGSTKSPASRPRLSLAPESFAPSAAQMGSFQTVRRARSSVPERFRGRLLLRRSTFTRGLRRTLSRAAIPKAGLPATRHALAAQPNEVNALARGVILELVLGELETDEMLERRIGD